MGAAVRVGVLLLGWVAASVGVALLALGHLPDWQKLGRPVVMAALAVCGLLPLLVARVLATPWTRRQTSPATRTSSILVMTLLLQGAAAVALQAAPASPNAPAADLMQLLQQAQEVAGTLNNAQDQVWEDTPPKPAATSAAATAATDAGTPAPPSGMAPAPGPTAEERRAAIRKVVETAPKGSVFLWTDAEGAVHMTQEAPPDSAQRVVVESHGGTFAEEGDEPVAPRKATTPSKKGKKPKAP